MQLGRETEKGTEITPNGLIVCDPACPVITKFGGVCGAIYSYRAINDLFDFDYHDRGREIKRRFGLERVGLECPHRDLNGASGLNGECYIFPQAAAQADQNGL